MSRYTGPSWKQARRLGLSLTGTGKELARRNYVPGQHGPNNRSKLSEYGLQLAEKQKLRFTYGVGERVDIPSYRVTPGQVISVREKSLKVPAILEAVEATLGRPAFVSFDAEKLEGSLTRLPERDEINPEINEALIVEFYNKML